MGKAILILLTAFSIGGITMATQSWSTERAADEDQIVEHAQMLAREIALSAYAIGVDRVKASFYERPIQGSVAFENVQFGEGFYDLYLLEMSSGAIRVTARGRMRVPVPDARTGQDYTERSHTVQGDFVGLQEPPGALVVDVEDPQFSFSGTEWQILGDDTRPPIPCDAEGGLTAGRGLATSSIHFTNPILNPLTEAYLRLMLATTTGGDYTITRGDVGEYFRESYVQAQEMALNGVTPGSRVITTSETFRPPDNTMLGSPTLPIALHVNGDVRLGSNVRGYGALIVDGDLEMEGTSSWEGVVYVVGSGVANIRMRGQSTIVGSLYASVEGLAGLGGRLDFRMEDRAKLVSSAEGLGILGNYLPALDEVSRVEPLSERHSPATSFLANECSGDGDPPPPDDDGGSGGGGDGGSGGGDGGSGGGDGGGDGGGEPLDCGCREGKVGVMHYPRNGNNHIICIAPPAVRAHTISPHHWARNGESDYVVCGL